MTNKSQYSEAKPTYRFSAVEEVDRELIQVKPELFQGRQHSYSEETVDKIVNEGFDKSDEPIVVWRDEEGDNVVLSGHSRWEASERLHDAGDNSLGSMPVKFFEGSFDAALDYALLESNRSGTPEGLKSDLSAFKRALDRGFNRKYLKGLFKPESRLRLLEDIAYLHVNGALLTFLGSSSESSFPYLQRNAQWIGSIRKTNHDLTDAHEQEMFNYLYPANSEGEAKRNKRISITKTQFFHLIQTKVARIDFDPDLALNLNETVSTNSVTAPAMEQIREIEKEIKKLTSERERKDELIAIASKTEEFDLVQKFQERQSEINTLIQRKLLEKQKLQLEVGRLERTTIDLFTAQALPSIPLTKLGRAGHREEKPLNKMAVLKRLNAMREKLAIMELHTT
jgi:hypothetical protein